MADPAGDPVITTPTINRGDVVSGTQGRMDGIVGRVESVNSDSKTAVIRFSMSGRHVDIELPLDVIVRESTDTPPTSENESSPTSTSASTEW